MGTAQKVSMWVQMTQQLQRAIQRGVPVPDETMQFMFEQTAAVVDLHLATVEKDPLQRNKRVVALLTAYSIVPQTGTVDSGVKAVLG